MEKRTVGIISTLVGASLWGFSGSCSQFLMENYAISTLFITMARMVGSAALFMVVILVRHRAAIGEILADRWALRRFILLGAFGLYLCQLTYLMAISYTNAGTATVLQALNIVIIMVATCLIVPRLPRAVELAGLVFALVSIVLIATQGDFGKLHLAPAGLFWGLVTAFCAAGYSMLPGPLHKRWSSVVVVGGGMFTGAIAAAAIWLLAFAFPGIDEFISQGNAVGTALIPSLDAIGVIALLTVVVVGTFLAFFLFLHGLSIVGPVQGSQLGAIEPVSAMVFSVLVAGSVFSVHDWLGLVFMVATILLVAAGGNDGNRAGARVRVKDAEPARRIDSGEGIA